MFNQKWEKERPLLSDYPKKYDEVFLLPSVPVKRGMGGTVWLAAGMLLLCGGCMRDMQMPYAGFGHSNPRLHIIKCVRSLYGGMQTGSNSSSHFLSSSSNHNVAEEPQHSPDRGKAKEEGMANSQAHSPIIEQEVSEKEEPAPVVPEVQEKGKKSLDKSAVSEKIKPTPAVPEAQEKGKNSAVESEVSEKESASPVLVPEILEQEKKAPSILVPEVPEKDNGQAIKSYKSKIEETRDLIRIIDEDRLTKEQHDTFHSIHSFLEKSQEAYSQDDMSMAVNLAEKAHTLAKEIVRNSEKK
jgi:hypothetical protein